MTLLLLLGRKAHVQESQQQEEMVATLLRQVCFPTTGGCSVELLEFDMTVAERLTPIWLATMLITR